MSVQVRPQTRLAAALVAAGVVSAASVAAMPAARELPTVSMDVANASAITDALSSFGKGVEVASSLVGIHVDATISVPFEATLALMAAQQHPELAPNVLSYLVQRFVNPAVGPPITAYPWLTEQTAALVASLLPYPLGPSATDIGLVNEARFDFADLFNGVLGQLPDPIPGYQAVQDVMNDTTLGGALVAGQLAARAPLYMAWSTANYLGNLPVNIEASLESAIATPDQIPGLVSNLVYGLLSPDAQVGLFGQLLNQAVDPFTWLPAPIGYSSDAAVGLANQLRAVVAGVMNVALSLLPAPVTPSALPTPTAPGAQPPYSVGAGKGATTPDALPTASVAIADAVTLAPVTEQPSAATLSRTLAQPTPTTPDADAVVTAPDDVATAASTVVDPPSAPKDDESAPKDAEKAKNVKDVKAGKDVDEKALPGKAKQPETTKDQPTRPSTTDDHATSVKAEPVKAEPASAAKESSVGTDHSTGDAG